MNATIRVTCSACGPLATVVVFPGTTNHIVREALYDHFDPTHQPRICGGELSTNVEMHQTAHIIHVPGQLQEKELIH